MAQKGSREQWLKAMLTPSEPVDPAATAAAVEDRRRRRRRGLCIGALVLLALAGVGVLTGLLVKQSLDRRAERASAAESGAAPAAAAAPVAVPVSSGRSTDGVDGVAAEEDDKRRFHWESQAAHIQASRAASGGRGGAQASQLGATGRNAAAAAPLPTHPPSSHPPTRPPPCPQEEAVFMPLGSEALLVQAQDGGGPLPFPYAGPGPCRSLRLLSNLTLDLSAAATGCRGLGQCQIGCAWRCQSRAAARSCRPRTRPSTSSPVSPASPGMGGRCDAGRVRSPRLLVPLLAAPPPAPPPDLATRCASSPLPTLASAATTKPGWSGWPPGATPS